ncbi:hypothetical protein ACFYNO_26260 [Kitasatospora sp. NPDC006697]|uniref:hypothetical protein n=1 Tax=Kitasatospora sp. NPDC006697 TaxID=3364020 RepID=UPI0036C64CB6
MRLVFRCIACGTSYLPPESMTYSDGPASPLWCTVHQAVARGRGIAEPPGAAAAALLMARRRADGPGVDEPARPDVRPSRPARTRRAPKPGGRRSKLS